MRNLSSSSRWFLVAWILVLFAAALPAQANDADVPGMVQQIFAARPAQPFVSVVLRDAANHQYLAYHISTYLDVKELRVYVVPFLGADVQAIDAALANGDHEAAFQKIISDMRIDLGAKYVADVGLDGIRDADVQLGQGHMRDNFHREQFADYATANTEYMRWLRRGLQILSS